MTMPIAQAVSLLHTTEMAVRTLVEQTASKGDYDAIHRLVELARSLQRMAGDLSGTLDGPAVAVAPRGGVDRPQTTALRDGKQRYPHFYRRDADLVKVGWSKRKKKEYEHKAPKQIVTALVHTIKDLKGRFAAEQVLPLGGREGSEVPAYQVYLSLAWLRALGLVKRHGRQGYSIAANADIGDLVTRAWQQLPAKLHNREEASNES